MAGDNRRLSRVAGLREAAVGPRRSRGAETFVSPREAFAGPGPRLGAGMSLRT